MSVIARDVEGRTVIELSIPTVPELLILARMSAATIATYAEFGIDDVEDLRLAVEELCLSVADADGGSRFHLVFECERRDITVTCRCEGPAAGLPTRRAETRELSMRILDELVDEHGRGTPSGAPMAWLRKRPTTQTA